MIKKITRTYLKEIELITQERDNGSYILDQTLSQINAMKEEQPNKPQTVSVREAAKILGISRNAIYEAVHTGKIPHIKIGSRIIIPRVRLMEMLSG